MITDILPNSFIERMCSCLGPESRPFFDSYSQPYVRGIRLRRKFESPDILEKVPWALNAFYLKNDSELGSSILHEAGAFYLQEPSAMMPPTVLDPLPGETILDLCAAPGGKSTQIAALMQGRGLLVCNEPIASRAKVLSMNIERMGVSNACVTSEMPWDLALKWPDSFDRILVDAPCSGEGMFRRHPETIAEWQDDTNQKCAERQIKILLSAARMLKPGGTLVYSTCTFSNTENEETIDRFLSERPDFSLVPFNVTGLHSCEGMLTIYPHQARGEGQFAAKLVRRGTPEAARAIGLKPVKDNRFYNLMRDVGFDILPERTAAFMNQYVLLPDIVLPLERIRVLRLGLHLCEERGSTLVPHHALALYGSRVDAMLTGQEAIRFIRGETIENKETLKGFVVVGYKNAPIGWGKAVDGMIKNHYPKGLRKQLPFQDQFELSGNCAGD